MKKLSIAFAMSLLLTGCFDDDDNVTPPEPDRFPPEISAVGDQTIQADSSANTIGLTVTDNESSSAQISLTATSADTSVVRNEDITVSASEITLSPVADTIGDTVITVTATDLQGNSASIEFNLTVAANEVAATAFVRDVFANSPRSEPVGVNGIVLIQDTEDPTEFDDLIQ